MKKFVSWNVNGLRACITKGFLDYFKKADADFFCIQETKLSQGQIGLELEGYTQVWNYAQRKGYSGTAVFSKHKPISSSIGIGIEDHDSEGRVITLEFEDFYLVNVYVPNSQRELKRIGYRMQWDRDFTQYLLRLDQDKIVILCGDCNVAHTEIDLKNPKNNRKNAGFTDEERQGFSSLLNAGFIDTFRHQNPDVTEAYSWWSYRFKARERNAGWRIDYFVVSDRAKELIENTEIMSDVMGSDHCPVGLTIDI